MSQKIAAATKAVAKAVTGSPASVAKVVKRTSKAVIMAIKAPPTKEKISRNKMIRKQFTAKMKEDKDRRISRVLKQYGGPATPMALAAARIVAKQGKPLNHAMHILRKQRRRGSGPLGGRRTKPNPRTQMRQEILGKYIYIYRQINTNQTIYSLFQTLKNNDALRQLTFVGKKSVPSVIRKDMWRPLAIVRFADKRDGLLAFHHMREYKLRHETEYDPQKLLTTSRTERKEWLMDQTANSVADLAAVLDELQGRRDSVRGKQKAKLKQVQRKFGAYVTEVEAEEKRLAEAEKKRAEAEEEASVRAKAIEEGNDPEVEVQKLKAERLRVANEELEAKKAMEELKAKKREAKEEARVRAKAIEEGNDPEVEVEKLKAERLRVTNAELESKKMEAEEEASVRAKAIEEGNDPKVEVKKLKAERLRVANEEREAKKAEELKKDLPLEEEKEEATPEKHKSAVKPSDVVDILWTDIHDAEYAKSWPKLVTHHIAPPQFRHSAPNMEAVLNGIEAARENSFWSRRKRRFELEKRTKLKAIYERRKEIERKSRGWDVLPSKPTRLMRARRSRGAREQLRKDAEQKISLLENKKQRTPEDDKNLAALKQWSEEWLRKNVAGEEELPLPPNPMKQYLTPAELQRDELVSKLSRNRNKALEALQILRRLEKPSRGAAAMITEAQSRLLRKLQRWRGTNQRRRLLGEFPVPSPLEDQKEFEKIRLTLKPGPRWAVAEKTLADLEVKKRVTALTEEESSKLEELKTWDEKRRELNDPVLAPPIERLSDEQMKKFTRRNNFYARRLKRLELRAQAKLMALETLGNPTKEERQKREELRFWNLRRGQLENLGLLPRMPPSLYSGKPGEGLEAAFETAQAEVRKSFIKDERMRMSIYRMQNLQRARTARLRRGRELRFAQRRQQRLRMEQATQKQAVPEIPKEKVTMKKATKKKTVAKEKMQDYKRMDATKLLDKKQKITVRIEELKAKIQETPEKTSQAELKNKLNRLKKEGKRMWLETGPAEEVAAWKAARKAARKAGRAGKASVVEKPTVTSLLGLRKDADGNVEKPSITSMLKRQKEVDGQLETLAEMLKQKGNDATLKNERNKLKKEKMKLWMETASKEEVASYKAAKKARKADKKKIIA